MRRPCGGPRSRTPHRRGRGTAPARCAPSPTRRCTSASPRIYHRTRPRCRAEGLGVLDPPGRPGHTGDVNRFVVDQAPPGAVLEHADQAVRYVERAVGIAMEYDSDTLPILDHYLRTVPQRRDEMVRLVAATSGAYFREVVRRRLVGQC